ncbi:hypothetical protein TRFO_30303 [Tritrichomonas foetus]|uniref:Phosphodiesterase n=1 Tax=Tritrichomonas foetus TaxID=1144522 RepID=A0A1J4JTR8_9EUKA|nr:hypothetical protein TRFO_30303 [Tritrichomonas foetus]|eukprot:OHT02521.1 hypothetical protein TRFO_30303 [Tritrichomonas foetus]
MNPRENSVSPKKSSNSSRSAIKSAVEPNEAGSSIQLARYLSNSDFSSLPSLSCHETIRTFLQLQNLALNLSSNTVLDDFYKNIENSIVTIIGGSSASIWIPFPNLQLLVRPTNNQTKPLPTKYRSTKDGKNCSVFLKESGECLGILDIQLNSEVPESIFILLSNFAKTAAVTLRRLNETTPNIQSVFLKALNIMTARNSDQLKAQCSSVKSLLHCDFFEPYLVTDTSMIPLFDNNNTAENHRSKIANGSPYISTDMIIWPLMNSKRRVSFVLLAKSKNNDSQFNYQDQLIMSLFAPVIQFTIQNLTSLERKRKQVGIINSLSRLSDTIEGIAAANDCPKCIGDLVNTACDVFDCEYGALYLIEQSKMNCCVTVGFSERLIVSKTDEPFSECLKEKAPVLCKNKMKFGGITAKSSVVSPIYGRNGEIRGILHLINKSDGFQTSDLRICRLFASLCGCALSVSNTEFLKLFNELISNEYKSEEFTKVAEKLAGIKNIEFIKATTEYPVRLYNSPVEYIKFDNTSMLSSYQKKFCRYLTNVATLLAENRMLKRFTLVDSVISDYMTVDEEKMTGIPQKLRVTSAEREMFNDLNLYTIDLDELHQFKLLFFIAGEANLFKLFNITARSLFSFLYTVKSKYPDNPYHNWFHAVDVLHYNYIISNTGGLNGKLKPIEQLALYMSLISHDIGHVGLSNGFLRQTHEPLSMVYDKSILETFHLSNMIQIMGMPGHNFLENATKEDTKKFWETSVHLILMTDMERHKDFMQLWENTVEKGIDWDSEEDRITVFSMFMKISDISNCSRPFEFAKNWGKRILEENFNQGDKEIELGLGYSAPLTNRNVQTLPKSQIGFYSFICIPFFKKLVNSFPKLQYLVDNIESNLAKWKELDENNITDL